MKKLMITCVLLSSAAVSFAQASATAQAPAPANNAAQAQQANKPMMNAEQMSQRRAKMEMQQFGLTQEQLPKVQAVELEFFQALEKYRASGAQPNQGQMGNLTAKRDAGMKAILTPEQYAKFQNGRNKEHMAPNTPAN
jgi:Spy/CpxP family protein refolding chaperone